MSPVTVVTLVPRRPPRWRHRRFTTAGEVALLLVGYALYSLLRDLVPRRITQADAHGFDVLHAEQLTHLAIEAPLNAWLASRHLLGQLSAYWYGIAHFAVTIALLLATRRLIGGRRLRLAWYGTAAIALLVFWVFPTAPPRLLPHAGFIDVLTLLPNPTTVSDPAVARLSNPYAALPSLHVAWAVWCAVVLWRLGGHHHLHGRTPRTTVRWLVRAVAIAYPITTAVVVLATANHYLTDVLAGVLTAAVSFALAQRLGVGQVDRVVPRETVRVRRQPTRTLARECADSSSAATPAVSDGG